MCLQELDEDGYINSFSCSVSFCKQCQHLSAPVAKEKYQTHTVNSRTVTQTCTHTLCHTAHKQTHKLMHRRGLNAAMAF